MSTQSKDTAKTQKSTFSYAKAAQGSGAPTPTAVSPVLNGRAASNESKAAVAIPSNGASISAPPAEKKSEPTPHPSHSSKSSVSSVSGGQSAWNSKTASVHMPARGGLAVANNLPIVTSNASVTFGNFSNPVRSPAPSVQDPSLADSTSAASGGAAPPALQAKDVPQFGSITPAPIIPEARPPSHSRTNSNASDFRPNNPAMQSTNQPFHGGYPSMNGQQYMTQPPYSPAMPNNFRGPNRGAMPYQQGRGNGARPPQAARGVPMNSPQQKPQGMQSPMASPAMFPSYMAPQSMYQPYGFPAQYNYQNQTYPQQQHMQNYVNPQAGRPQFAQNQYQNPNLQAPSASTMSRSGSAISERPGTTMTSNTTNTAPVQQATPTFSTPRKKGSSAIKIVNPNSKEEVVLPKAAAAPPTSEPRRENIAISSPKPDRPVSTGPPRTASATPQVAETPEQIQAKKDAAKQAILEKIAASKAEAAAAKAEEDRIRAEADAELKRKQAETEAAELAKKLADEKAAQEERDRIAAEEAKAAEAKRQQDEAEKAARAAEAAEAAAKAEEEKVERERLEAIQTAKREADAAAARQAEDARKTTLEEEARKQEVPQEQEPEPLDTIVEDGEKHQTSNVLETKVHAQSELNSKSMPPPAIKKRPSSLSIETTAERSASAAMVTALVSSSAIQDIHAITYPEGISPPDVTLNQSAKASQFKYDKAFLLQFQKVYTDKPTLDWETRLRDTVGEVDNKAGKAMGGRTSSHKTAPSPFSVSGAFNPKPLKSSEDRFKQSSKLLAQGIDPAAALAGNAGPSFERGSNFKPSLPRKDSHIPGSPRADSKRGGKSGRAPSTRPEKAQIGAPTIAPEDVKPLANSGNRWTPKRAVDDAPLPGGGSTAMAPEVVQRKVKGLLNKLTVDNFDKITDQILEIAAQSKDEQDGRTLRQVIALTFEKATDEAHFSNMYARFCRKTMERTSNEVQDASVTDRNGQLVVGGALFRKYLLSRCQEDFQRGWKSNLPAKPDGEPQTEEAAMLSDEYYIAAAAKRRGLGLVKFIGELFLMHMLNEKIMQETITKLLNNVTDPEEEEVESLAKLVETVGAALDSHEKGARAMAAYMERMRLLTMCDTLSSRIKFMVMDVIDLRAAGWQSTKADKGPKTIQEIHDDAAKAAAVKEAQRGSTHRGNMGGMRLDYGRGDARTLGRRQDSHGMTNNPMGDGWNNVNRTQAPPPTAGDLAKFGKFTQPSERTASRSGTFGPGGNLATARTNSKQASRTASTTAISREDSRSSQTPAAQNTFAVLGGETETSAAAIAANADVKKEDASGRPRLNLLPKGATDGSELVPTNSNLEEGEIPS